MPRRGCRALPVILACSLLMALPAAAARLRVPEDHLTLRAAVRAAAGGDTILLAPGLHDGGAFVEGKPVTIASGFLLSGDTSLVAQTILRGAAGDVCAGAPNCVGNAVIEFGERTAGSAVVGLTVTQGEDGIRSGSRVDVVRCRIVANGDGVDYVSGAGGILRDNLFADNRDDGIDLNGRVDVTVIGNEIRDNREDGVEFRLYAYRGPTLEVRFIGNRITGNRGDGIQLIDYVAVSDLVIRIEGNIFSANGTAAIGCMPDGRTREDLSGAAMAERLILIHNTFMLERYGLVGGARVVAVNNLFTAVQGSALRRVRGVAAYNLFWGNRSDEEQCQLDASHRLTADPRLDAWGRPGSGSPAIDAGAARFVVSGDTLRLRSNDGYAGSAPDIGAFERRDVVLPARRSPGRR